ncbi:copper chaperone PCu(A)C [Sphingomonas sp. BAUL-RG-20F-R05-02]|uniref:copper chaperone PCu(A)C n=1 Tax=Sphingomonas sp. BAUL-RG-20F-R05-02 TaxID=2914830 RepID=UPI001F5AF25B|nr:copper chaperone PCu(A)C [Sphingomonas sp. BAUL-RG-20F-R05-02]
MRILGLLLVLLLGISGCSARQFYIDHGYVRLAAAPGRPAVAYFTLHGGSTDTTLVAVHSEFSLRTELHQSMTSGGMAAMKPLDQVALPAGGKVAFKPGGMHVMLFGLNPVIKPGKTMTLQFTFADGNRYDYEALVIAPGDPAPKF